MDYSKPIQLIENRADPHIYKHSDGYYYFTATVPEYDSIVLRRSSTLIGLSTAEEYTVWKKHETGEMSHFIWAPEIHYINQKWVIYFAAKDTDSLDHSSKAHRIYVIECDNENPIEGSWMECGQLKTNWESFSLDATTFEHKGIRYLVWAQMDIKISGNSNIYIAKMKSTIEIEGEQVLLTKPELPWETIGFEVNEGPSVIQVGDKIILTYSSSATDANYAMGMLVADINSDMLDRNSWIKWDKPIRKTDRIIGEYGPGHNCFTTSEDDKTFIVVYHARNYEMIEGDPLYDINRHTKIVELKQLEGLSSLTN